MYKHIFVLLNLYVCLYTNGDPFPHFLQSQFFLEGPRRHLKNIPKLEFVLLYLHKE